MLVLVEATDPFVTILSNGDMISAIRGERVMLPKARADALASAGLCKFPAVPTAPEVKSSDPEPEVKTGTPKSPVTKPRAKRQPAKPKPVGEK